MAWNAYLLDDVGLSADVQYVVNIAYYDDADPKNATVSPGVRPTVILHQRVWTLALGTTIEQLQAAVVAEGQQARSALAALVAAQQQAPRGATLPIP